MEIKSRWSGKVLYTSKQKTVKETLIKAVDNGAYLRGAYLGGAYLRGADLGGADLGVKIPPTDTGSNYFWAELLKREAKTNIKKLQFAGLVQLQIDWCWGKWGKIINKHFKPLKKWILSVDQWDVLKEKLGYK